MSVEQKLRVANAVQIFCGAAFVGLLIAYLVIEFHPLILILPGLVVMAAAYSATFNIRCPRCRKPVFFYDLRPDLPSFIPGWGSIWGVWLCEPEHVCSRCGKILIYDK